MLFGNVNEINQKPTSLDGAKGFYVRWLVAKEQGSQKFALRVWTVDAKGFLPMHKHKYEEAVLILNGSFKVTINNTTKILGPDDYFYTAPYEPHSMENLSEEEGKFICVISYEDDMKSYRV